MWSILLLVVLLLMPTADARAQAPTVSVEPVLGEVTEGEGPLHVVVMLGHAASTATSVRVQSVPVTADAADFVVVDRVVPFPPGHTSMPVSIDVIDDALDEPRDETFMLVLSEFDGLVAGAATTTLTVRDNDEFITAAAEPAAEGGTARVVLSRKWPSTFPVTVRVDLEPGDATSADYRLDDPVAVFSPGDVVASLPIAILEDDEEELEETFTARLAILSSAPRGTALLAPPSLVMTIPADERVDPTVRDRAFRAEIRGEIRRLITGPFVENGDYIGHAPSSSCQYHASFESDDGWEFTVAMELPHLEPGVRYPVRSPIEHDGDAYVPRRLVEGAVAVTVSGPDAPGPGTYYGTLGILTFSEFDARFGSHEDRPVAGRLQAQLERVEFHGGDHPYREILREGMEVHGSILLDLTFASDRALIDRQMGDCGRPD